MTSNLNIYLVERTDNWTYDEYSDFVVVCATPEEAANTKPGSGKGVNGGWKTKYCTDCGEETEHYQSWVPYDRKDELLKVTLIGNAVLGSVPKIICSSYHAG